MDSIPFIRLFGQPALAVSEKSTPLGAREAAVVGFLLHSPNGRVAREQLARLLWPKVTLASARRSLSQTLYTLRKKLGDRAIVSVGQDSISVGTMASDVAELRERIERAEWREALAVQNGAFLEGVSIPGGAGFDHWLEGVRAEYDEIARRVGVELSADEPDADSSERRYPFVGRDEILQVLQQRLTAAQHEGFQAVVLQGEAGIGKTVLADRFARKAALGGAAVAMGQGFPAERNVPFGLAAQWLRALGPRWLAASPSSWLTILQEVFPGTLDGSSFESYSSGEITGEYRVLEALRQAFVHVSMHAPILIVLDDLQLADAASLGFLHYLKRRSPDARIMALATIRTPSASGDDPLAEWSDVHRIPIAGLSLDEIHLLARKMLPPGLGVTQDEVVGLAERSGRNPLVLASFFAFRGDREAGVFPRDVLDWFNDRFEGLSRDSRLLLAAFSLVEDRHMAEEIAGISTPGALAAIEQELQDAGLVELDNSGDMRPRHGIVPEIATASLTPADRKAIHGRAARTMAESGWVPPAVVAVQHDIAGDQPGAYQAALRAADASGQLYAAREEEFFLKLALSNAPSPVDSAHIRLRLAELYRRVGRPAKALEVADDRVLLDAPVALRRKAQATRLKVRLSARMGERLLDRAEAELAELEPLIDPDTAVELLVAFSKAANDLGSGRGGGRAARRALEISQAGSTTGELAMAEVGAATMIGIYDDLTEGLREVKGREHLSPEFSYRVNFLSCYATLLVRAGRVTEAEGLFVEAVGIAERCVIFDRLFTIRNNLGVCLMEQGRYAEAESELKEAVRACEIYSSVELGDVALDNLVLVEYERGNIQRAFEIGGDLLSRGPISDRGMFYRHGLGGLAALQLGRLSYAYESRREILLLLDSREYWGGDFSYVETFLARMLTLEGKPDEARQRLRTAIDVYRRRDVLARARLELELARMDLKTDPAAAGARAAEMLDVLRGSGARPLIERFEEVADSARIRAGR